MKKLSQKDKRTLKFGAVCAVAIVGFALATEWLGHWKKVRNSGAGIENKLEAINISETKRAGLISIVPTFEMPEKEETQKYTKEEKSNYKGACIRV